MLEGHGRQALRWTTNESRAGRAKRLRLQIVSYTMRYVIALLQTVPSSYLHHINDDRCPDRTYSLLFSSNRRSGSVALPGPERFMMPHHVTSKQRGDPMYWDWRYRLWGSCIIKGSVQMVLWRRQGMWGIDELPLLKITRPCFSH